MTTAKLKEILTQGREIEFSHDGHPYFLAPLFSNNSFTNEYYIYDSLANRILFAGRLYDILTYQFSSDISFERTIEAFDFKYIL